MNIFIVPIEPIDSRYTKQWYGNIPLLINQRAKDLEVAVNVITIDGDDIPEGTTAGAFLNFGATNYYKSTQAAAVSKLFMEGSVKPGDKFLITDAWNFIITPIKYMSELLDIPVEIHSIWHAGAYDPSDILGMKMSKPWPWYAEISWYLSSDYNYFATDFHKDMFMRNLDIQEQFKHKAVRSGQPHDPIIPELEKYLGSEKLSQVMWPHRYNADKQPDIAEDLMSDFDMVITQKMSLSKDQYYQTMGASKAIFSCSLHENLGISIMEAVLAGAIPIVPNRCSYSEMYLDEFKYPSEWTANFAAYQENKDKLIRFIKDRIDNYQDYVTLLERQRDILKQDYLTANIMIDNILNANDT
jgi:hypothetical protein